MVGANDTPYICPITGTTFQTEAAFVNYMKCTHDVDLQIEGEVPEIQFQTVAHPDYVPVAYYVCPKTGNCFYTEAELCCWMAQIDQEIS